MSSEIESTIARKLELRLEGKKTLGSAKNEATDDQDTVDMARMLVANHTALFAMKKSGFIITESKVVSRKNFLGKAIIIVKRLIRKSIRWYIRPPMAQQSEFNRNNVEVISNLQTLIVRQQEIIEQLQADHEEFAHTLREKLDMYDQVNAKQLHWMELNQPYMDVLLEWKGKTDDELQQISRSIRAIEDTLKKN
jgi:hypothetical protein